MNALHQAAEAAGIELDWHDIEGGHHRVPDGTLVDILRAMGLPTDQPSPVVRLPIIAEPDQIVILKDTGRDVPYRLIREDGHLVEGRTVATDGATALAETLPLGLHRLQIAEEERFLLIAPPKALAPSDLGVERCFGIGVQLYGLRTRRQSDLGDFGDLKRAVERFADAGADFVGLNPLHGLFLSRPEAASPYSPSSRRFLNPLYISVDRAASRLGQQLSLPPALSGDLVDYPVALRRKLQALEQLFAGFEGSPEFERYRAAGGEALERHCLFEALQEQGATERVQPGSDVAAAFAHDHQDRMSFFAFLQWLADLQLEEAQVTARDAGMAVGLYRDLAVGVDPEGSMVWSAPDVTLRGVSIGAPPDAFSPLGQMWNLAPFSPPALAARGFRPLLDDLEANARHTGALRIDHIIGWQRQFWIPAGKSPAEGAYVRFPFDVLARLAALVSHRHRCLIIGEDLGTVPEGFRPKMQACGMLSCRVIWFERDGDRIRKPSDYPNDALASITTHDLPTVRGFWRAQDIAWRERLGIEPDAQAARDDRERDKALLVQALRDAGVLNEEATPDAIVAALHRFLARTNSALALVQLEDLAGLSEQPNLPGTIHDHPNWRRRLPLAIEDLLERDETRDLLRMIAEERAG